MLISSDVQFLIEVPFGGRATAGKELQNLRYTRANDHNLHNNIYTHCTFSRLFSIGPGENTISHLSAFNHALYTQVFVSMRTPTTMQNARSRV